VPAEDAYGILADYEVGHPAILPRPPFGALRVLKGGRGAGTEIVVEMTALGRTQSLRAVVSEPEPGRLLVERYPDTGATTSFRVEPLGPSRCEVTIETDWQAPAPRGWIERMLAPRLLRRTYDRELQNLEVRASEPR